MRPFAALLPNIELMLVSLPLTVNSILARGVNVAWANDLDRLVTSGMLATSLVIVEFSLSTKDSKDSNTSNGLPPPAVIASTASPKPLEASHTIGAEPPVFARMLLAVWVIAVSSLAESITLSNAINNYLPSMSVERQACPRLSPPCLLLSSSQYL